MHKKLLLLLIIWGLNAPLIAQDTQYISTDDDTLTHLIMEANYGNYFSQDSLIFSEINFNTTYNTFNNNSTFHPRYGLGILMNSYRDLSDISLRLGGSYAPFSSILYFNFDFDLSFGVFILNNISGTLKPSVSIHIPFHRTNNGFEISRLNFVIETGYYSRFSNKIIGFLGQDNFYQKSSGYFVQFGIAFEIRGDI